MERVRLGVRRGQIDFANNFIVPSQRSFAEQLKIQPPRYPASSRFGRHGNTIHINEAGKARLKPQKFGLS